MLRLKPSGGDDFAEVLFWGFWVFARAIERPGADPEDRRGLAVWVSLDHRIEKVDGSGLGPRAQAEDRSPDDPVASIGRPYPNVVLKSVTPGVSTSSFSMCSP